MLEVQLELDGPNVVWVPNFNGDGSHEDSVRGMMLSWIRGFFGIGTLIRRLDSGEGKLPAWLIIAFGVHFTPVATAHCPACAYPLQECTPRNWRRMCAHGRRSAA